MYWLFNYYQSIKKHIFMCISETKYKIIWFRLAVIKILENDWLIILLIFFLNSSDNYF